MKKIIFHINSLGRGGAERVVSNLSEKLSMDGYHVIIAMEWQAENEYETPSDVEKVYIGIGELEENIGRVSKIVKRFTRLRQLIKKEKPDLLIVFGRSAIYRALLSNLLLGIPSIISVRNDPRSEYMGFKNRICRVFLQRLPKGCVFQTQDAQSFFSKRLQNKSVIIPNPVNPKYIGIPQKTIKDKTIVTIGRLVKQKNQQLLVSAFAIIHKDYPDYQLLLYGEGENDGTEAILHGIIKENKLEDVVKFMGITTCIEDVVKDATMFVLPSIYEGMPNALMEAMIMGTPVISTDCPCGGPRFLIEHNKNGLLIPVGDKEELVKQMRRILEDEQFARSLGEEAKKTVDKVDPVMIYHKWKSFIDSVI